MPNETEELRTQIANLKVEIAKKNKTILVLEREKEEQKLEYENKLGEEAGKASTAEKTVYDSQQTIDQLTKDLKEAVSAREGLQTTYDSLQEKYGALETAAQEKDNLLKEKDTNITDLEKRLGQAVKDAEEGTAAVKSGYAKESFNETYARYEQAFNAPKEFDVTKAENIVTMNSVHAMLVDYAKKTGISKDEDVAEKLKTMKGQIAERKKQDAKVMDKFLPYDNAEKNKAKNKGDKDAIGKIRAYSLVAKAMKV